ncbi:MAG: hypothetical protein OXC11_08115, partial [Rhodospirillales bacterium]|nr:hypothetical protein [Rhodospirillales bacterium]
ERRGGARDEEVQDAVTRAQRTRRIRIAHLAEERPVALHRLARPPEQLGARRQEASPGGLRCEFRQAASRETFANRVIGQQGGTDPHAFDEHTVLEMPTDRAEVRVRLIAQADIALCSSGAEEGPLQVVPAI